MLHLFGRIFFPTLLHREKELRKRMRLVTIVFCAILVAVVTAAVVRINKSKPRFRDSAKPIKVQSAY